MDGGRDYGLMNYKERRDHIMRTIDGTIFLRGQEEQFRNADSEFSFRQNSSFLYLTGVSIPDVAMMLNDGKFNLFYDPLSAEDQAWVGKQPSREELKERTGADAVYPLDKICKKVKGNVHSLKSMASPFRYQYRQLANALVDMRMIKDDKEIATIEKALSITAKAHLTLMRMTRPGISERDLEAVTDLLFRQNGAVHAYLPIVTTKGEILHSNLNSNTLLDGKMLLVDAGCEVAGYASDITRTYPVNGIFNAEQADVYDIVLQAKKEAIAMLKPGVMFEDIDKHTRRVVAQGLRSMGVLKGNVDDILENDAQNLFYMHGLGHPLGLDVHDCCDLIAERRYRNKPLEAGHVTTIEPGIYFNKLLFDDEAMDEHKEFVDFDRASKVNVSGVRIEDDVLVTQTARVLGPKIPEERAELEALIGTSIMQRH